jgi:predicted AAA+ superfamily ATPase
MRPRLLPRFAERLLVEALADTPVVLIHGPRQCGKTTLARVVGDRLGYEYVTFDDDTMLAAAQSDPIGFVDGLPERTILDEVQRAPGLFTSLKAAVDRHRTSGLYLLTGSANVLLLPRLADSLAGRIAVLRLHPLAQRELAGRKPGFLDALFAARFPTRRFERLGNELTDRIVAGGYPAALDRRDQRRRSAWYRDYIESLVQRDVRDLSRIRSLDALPRLLAAIAATTACLQNTSDLASPFQLSRPTIGDYVTILERVFLVDSLPPWHSNRLSRLVKTPKLHLGDTGLACALLKLDAAALTRDRQMLGRLLETFVFQELSRQASWHSQDVALHHFRDKDGAEVDVVLERGPDEVAGVEVKSAASVTSSDFRGLRRLREATGRRFRAGIVLYDGESRASFGDGLYAVPIRTLWEKS